MTTQLHKSKTYTVEEYLNLPDNGKRYELIEGDLIEMPGPNHKHGIITSRLNRIMGNFLASNGQSPDLALTNMAFALSLKTAVNPDVAFIKEERAVGVDLSKPFQGAPDLAIEVLSPTDKWSDVIAKVRLYQSYQVTLVWVVDPFDQSVFVYRPNQLTRLLYAGSDLSGEDVVPGFTLPVKDLFTF
jgi:Uma2 family endonuclease